MSETRGQKIVRIALSYVGITEISGNKGWTNAAFQKKMQEMGWLMGHAWCAYTGELIWKEGYADKKDVVKLLDRLFSASAVATFHNFSGSGHFKVSKVPVPGAIAIWQSGNTSFGHLGVVTQVGKGTFETVEGNSNDDGSREGIEVAHRKGARSRKIDFTRKNKGLNLLGFVIPNE